MESPILFGEFGMESPNVGMFHQISSSESFGYTEDQIVSCDIIGMKFGSLFDATQTMVSKIDEDKEPYQVWINV